MLNSSDPLTGVAGFRFSALGSSPALVSRLSALNPFVSYWLLPGQTLPAEIRTEDIICDPGDTFFPLSP
jgi:hypothetical protein